MLRRLGLQQVAFFRHYSGPPLKRYNGFTNGPSLIWNTLIPAPAKLFGGILTGAITLTHVHPNVVVTLGPPIVLGAYFIMRRLNHHMFLRLLSTVKPSKASKWDDDAIKVRVWKYDEEDAQNVLRGIDNQFQHFEAQVLLLVEKLIVDHVIEQESLQQVTALVSLLLDENKQVVVHLGELPETFVTTKAEVVAPDGSEQFVEYVRFSVPIYSSKNVHKRLRLGVADVSMLAMPEYGLDQELPYQDYRLAIELTPYKIMAKTEMVSVREDTGIISIDSFKSKVK